MRIIKVTSLLVILVAGLLFGITYVSRHRNLPTAPSDFKVVYNHILQQRGEIPKLYATSVRFVRPGSRWKEVTTYYQKDGTTREQVGIGGASIEQASDKNQNASTIDDFSLTAEQLRKHPQFVREDTVLGYRVFVLRVTTASIPDRYIDFYLSPEFTKTFLKTIVHQADGSEMVSEPTNIQVGPIDSANFTTGY